MTDKEIELFTRARKFLKEARLKKEFGIIAEVEVVYDPDGGKTSEIREVDKTA